MNSVDNDVGAQPVIAEHLADDSGFAVVERAHSVESVGRVPRSGLDGLLRDRHLRVRVPHADANISPRRLRDHFHRAGNFRSDGQHPHMPARRLPKTLEDFERRRDQVFRRMHSPALVAEKRSFEVNPQRTSLRRIIVRRGTGCFDRVGQSFQRRTGRIERCRDGGRKISCNPVRRQELSQARQFGLRGPHRIHSCSAVDMNVNKARRQHCVAEIDQRSVCGNFCGGS